MDWFTVAVLAPVGTCLALIGWGYWHASARVMMAAWFVMGLYVMAVYDGTDVRCLWEGFEDGLLPIECRAMAT